jgi:adenylate cyclase
VTATAAAVDARPEATGKRARQRTARLWQLARGLWSRPRVLACLLLAAALLLRVEDPAAIEGLRLRAFDLFQLAQPMTFAQQAVAIVDIDERSLAALGQWPWPRTQIAQLIRQLADAGALAIGFDVLFAEPDRLSPALFATAADDLTPEIRAALAARPSNDAMLAEVLRQVPVVLGVSATHERDHPYAGRHGDATPVAEYNGDPRPFLPAYGAVIRNIEALEQAAPGRGMITLSPEQDGLVRRVPAVLRVDDGLYPTLAVEMLRVALGRPNYGVVSDPNGGGVRGLRIGRLEVPTDLNGQVWLRYADHAPERYISAAEVLAGTFRPERVQGKLVLVGTSAVGLRDLRATPVHAAIPGVEIHAQLLETILAQEFLRRPNYALGVELALTLLIGALLVVLVPKRGALGGLALFAGGAALLVGGSWYLFGTHALMLDATYPLLTGAAVFLQLAYANYSRAEEQRRQVRTAFSQFLAPALVERLVADPDQLRLGGEVREMTFLFSDIAGFTSLTEQTAPEVLVGALNAYLDGMCQIVMDHGGTIDKIVGDAIHAIFNAPLDQPDHAARAVTCALAMGGFSERFAAAQRTTGVPFGGTRIGVNTGTAVIGNFGGRRRFDYTAHGDAINTAARLESVNKHLGTSICVAGSTAAQCPELRFRPVGTIILKGKTQGIEAFEPIAEGAGCALQLAAYCAAFSQLRDGEAEARGSFARLAQQHPEDPLIALHARRSAAGELGAELVMSEK